MDTRNSSHKITWWHKPRTLAACSQAVSRENTQRSKNFAERLSPPSHDMSDSSIPHSMRSVNRWRRGCELSKRCTSCSKSETARLSRLPKRSCVSRRDSLLSRRRSCRSSPMKTLKSLISPPDAKEVVQVQASADSAVEDPAIVTKSEGSDRPARKRRDLRPHPGVLE